MVHCVLDNTVDVEVKDVLICRAVYHCESGAFLLGQLQGLQCRKCWQS